jgi:sec-independent protein translocase protein TatB
MFDIGADELLLTAVVAIVVIGPKDMPRALRTVGRWVAKMRRMSNAFRAGIENVIREAELEEMEEEWRKQNAAIMASHPPTSAEASTLVEADALAAAAAAEGNAAALPPPEVLTEPAPSTEPAPPRVEPAPPADNEPVRTPGRLPQGSGRSGI